MPHCGFDLHYPTTIRVSFHMHVGHLSVFFGEISVQRTFFFFFWSKSLAHFRFMAGVKVVHILEINFLSVCIIFSIL